eukprot:Filipodium_phascolosomae@DN493_c0_g1_i1.p1
MSQHVIGAIDQGTQSTKFVLFDNKLGVVAEKQLPHQQYYPKSGWCEHDAMQIWDNTVKCIQDVMESVKGKNLVVDGIGVTNQRETTIAWDRNTGKPLFKAIVWLDTRTQSIVDDICAKHSGANSFRAKVGLPVNTYFSAAKIKWLFDNVPAVRDAAKAKRLCIGTIDSWLMFKLSGNTAHVTDITNAQRTFLVDVKTCTWSQEMCDVFGVPMDALPQIKSCAEELCKCTAKELHSGIQKVAVTGCAGDQQAACIGQGLFANGQVKCTFGTGAFILRNTGTTPAHSAQGLLTTPCYQLGKDAPVTWALEGSIPIAGAGVSWLKDNMGMLTSAKETGEILRNTKDTGDVYMVPAFSGLFAPRWRGDARGTIAGLTQATTREHIVRALLEAIGFQMKEVFAAMAADANSETQLIKVDGGMCHNPEFMQLVCDLCGVDVAKPENVEVTVLGAAIAAGLGCGFFKNQEEVAALITTNQSYKPVMPAATATTKYNRWKMAVDRSLGWEEASS